MSEWGRSTVSTAQQKPQGNRGIRHPTPKLYALDKLNRAMLTTPGGPDQEANEAKVKPQGQ